jgi:hypothetical protein
VTSLLHLPVLQEGQAGTTFLQHVSPATRRCEYAVTLPWLVRRAAVCASAPSRLESGPLLVGEIVLDPDHAAFASRAARALLPRDRGPRAKDSLFDAHRSGWGTTRLAPTWLAPGGVTRSRALPASVRVFVDLTSVLRPKQGAYVNATQR